ncbi:MAG: 16S rRNA (cytidine(1402)-2'-O)-methyltransferase [Deltaproteobacteria bacterium]|nr:16S rRNA (cytidine(1402)-2'-O)-methyltransferase [Deltaproteobacteria bacterium]
MTRGTLYVVATPIGNLEDITLRALRVLKEVDLIAAEDTRHTRKLLTHYGISTPLTSYYDQVEAEKAPVLVEQLQMGKRIALVSDAGTPAISDPGFRLVKGAWEAGVPVVPVPGASTLTALLSVGGLPTDTFIFEGFLPAKPGQRQKALERLKHEERTLVFFESPHRLFETLSDIEKIFGDRDIVIGRELTKMYEEVRRGPVSEVRQMLQGREVKGEVALLVSGWDGTTLTEEPLSLVEEIQLLEKEGLSLKEIAQTVSERRKVPKREVYALGVRLKESKQ